MTILKTAARETSTMLKHPKIALDFSGAKFSLRLFVPHEFDKAYGKAMLKDPLEGHVKYNGLTTVPYRCKAITHSFHEFEEKHLQELLLTDTLG